MTHRRVREVMTRDVVCAHEDTPFKEAAALMVGRGVSALPVLDSEDRVAGVVSESDLLRKQECQPDPQSRPQSWWRWRELRKKAESATAGEMMTSPAVTVGPDTSIVAAARKLDSAHVKRLPVVGPDGRLAGIASRRDLLRVFLRSDQQIADEVKAEVFGEALGANLALVDVSVSEGVVALGGEVERKSMIAFAVRLASAVDGVVTVVDHLGYGVDDTNLPRTADVDEYRHTVFTPGNPDLKQVE